MIFQTLFILLLICITQSSVVPGLLTFPNLDDPNSESQNIIDSSIIASIGILSSVPEIITDTLKTVLDINKPNLPKTPVPDLIANEGYPCETHYITTKDGYILATHRIPYGKTGNSNGKVVLLQHGLLTTSSDWVLLGSKHGLGYLLADEGYDVWMPNSRGNTYSKNHTNLTPADKQFWQFSWHELGIYDVPACIDYILNHTGQSQLFHVGHSQGTTSFYVMTSEKPEYNQKVKAHISLAPVVYLSHMFSPVFRLISNVYFPLQKIFESFGQYEFIPDSKYLDLFKKALCTESIGKVLCKNIILSLVGFGPKQMNVFNIPLIMGHYPSGASIYQVIHYGQEIKSGKFQQFDFGIEENLKKYNDNIPPEYRIDLINTPVHLLYGSNDWLAASIDVHKFYSQLRCTKYIYNIPIQSWNHLDFTFGKDAREIVYKKVSQIFSHY